MSKKNEMSFEEKVLDILKKDSIKKEDDKVVLNLSQFNKIELLDKELLKDDSNYILKIQSHEVKDRDIKLESRKIDNYNLKLIYHKKKDGQLEYRIFVAFKENDALKRIRLVNPQITEIQNNESKMRTYLSNIQRKDIDGFLKQKLS